ncbi:unnamed protein product [Fraxinus pennsylvanica]|uniref:Conserved oligomeric Golgi complex subunit 7 n=1 Tax=Fraxinus pennsylvanica TaxID=56036 RepID=A0AAD2EFS8_9LAMI|nr:unnamed protein product [Fraxinus pennsylvanica]
MLKGNTNTAAGEGVNGTEIAGIISSYLLYIKAVLVGKHDDASSLLALIKLFTDSDLHVLLNILKAIYLPYETFKQRNGQMDRVVLSDKIAGLDLRGVTTRIIGVLGVELNEMVRRMEESVPLVILLLEAAAERCINFVGGSEADELIHVLDDTLQK